MSKIVVKIVVIFVVKIVVTIVIKIVAKIAVNFVIEIVGKIVVRIAVKIVGKSVVKIVKVALLSAYIVSFFDIFCLVFLAFGVGQAAPYGGGQEGA